jgi:hypothetical protein
MYIYLYIYIDIYTYMYLTHSGLQITARHSMSAAPNVVVMKEDGADHVVVVLS